MDINFTNPACEADAGWILITTHARTHTQFNGTFPGLPGTRSTQPCIPPGSLNRVPALAGVRAGMSPLPGGR